MVGSLCRAAGVVCVYDENCQGPGLYCGILEWFVWLARRWSARSGLPSISTECWLLSELFAGIRSFNGLVHYAFMI